MKRSRLKKSSSKRAKEQRIFTGIRKTFMEANPWCKFPTCGRQSEELHHAGGKEGQYLTYEPWFIALCRTHHRWVENHKQDAIDLGLSVSNNLSFKDFQKTL